MGNKGERGTKRKRPGSTQQEDMTSKVTGKLHHSAKEVRKAAKKAKAFELQKVVKKLKSLRAKSPASPEIADIEEQLQLLKQLEHEPFGNTALVTKIKKDKKLHDNPHVIAAIASELTHNLVTPAALGSNLAKIQGRILSSKLIANEMITVLDTLKAVLSPEKKRKQGAEDEGVSGDEETAPSRAKKSRTSPLNEDASGNKSSRDDRISEGEDGEEDDGWESGSIHDEEDGGASSGESDEEEDENKEAGSDGSEDGDTEEELEESPKVPKRGSKSVKSSGVVSKAGESTFLPTLSVGFTRGDSDASDVDENELRDIDGTVKKNRRGQRARRAIWEKKYGKNANHVKKEQEAQKVTGFKSRGTLNQRPGQRSGPPPRRDAAPQTQSQGGQSNWSTASRPKQREEEKPLHPSWEAKRRLKEKQNMGIVAPQGKKIVF